MFNKFQQIPKSMQLVAAALCGIALLAVTAMINRQAFLIAALGIALVVGAMFLWQFYVKFRGRARAKAMTGQITVSTAPNALIGLYDMKGHLVDTLLLGRPGASDAPRPLSAVAISTAPSSRSSRHCVSG